MGGGRFEGANLHLTAMSDTIISVEGLGKKYVLNHQGERGGYSRFSEKLEGWIKKPFAALARGSGVKGLRGQVSLMVVTHLPSPIFHLRPRKKSSGH